MGGLLQLPPAPRSPRWADSLRAALGKERACQRVTEVLRPYTKFDGGQGRNRTTDTRIFSPVSAVLGASRSITCDACQPRPQPHPGTVTAHQSELVTFLAHPEPDRPGTEFADLLVELVDEHKAFGHESLPARPWRPRTDGDQVRRNVVRHRGHSGVLQAACKDERHPRKAYSEEVLATDLSVRATTSRNTSVIGA